MIICMGLICVAVTMSQIHIQKSESFRLEQEEAFAAFQEASSAGQQLFEVQCESCHTPRGTFNHTLSSFLKQKGDPYFLQYIMKEDVFRKDIGQELLLSEEEKAKDYSHKFELDHAEMLLLLTYLKDWENSMFYVSWESASL